MFWFSQARLAVPMETIKQAFLEILKGVASDVVVKEDKEIRVNNTTVTSMVVNGKSEGTPYTFPWLLVAWRLSNRNSLVLVPKTLNKDDIEKVLNVSHR